MENSLESILSGNPAPTEEAQPEREAPEVVEQESGEENTGTPPEQPQKDDPLEKHRKGLEAAAAAERKKRQDAEARAEAAERRARELEQRQQPQRHTEQADDPKPLRQQFQTEDEWLDARDEWRDRQRERATAMERAQQEQKAIFEKTESIYAQAQALEGFDRAAFDALPLTKPLVEALIDSDNAPALMRFMAANPAEVKRIAALSNPRQVAELTRIEDRLAATTEEPEEQPEPKKPLPKTLTQARDARGRYEPAYSGPTPLNAILASK
jgi:hypothetical protein